MKLWLDDVREPLSGEWVWIKTVPEAIKFCSRNMTDEWSLDHDLGGQLAHIGKGPYDYTELTGLDFVMALHGQEFPVNLPPKISIHSTNWQGVAKMVGVLHQIAQLREQNIEIIVKPMLGKILDQQYRDRPKVVESK